MTILARDGNAAPIQCLSPIAATERVTISGANAAAPAIAAGYSVVRVAANTDCYYRIGTAAAATTASYLPAGVVEYIRVNVGDVINVIGTSGYLYITPMS